MTTSASVVNAIVDDLINDLSSNATTVGLSYPARVYERDEHPQAALNRGDLPCAYVIPFMEGGSIIKTDIDPVHEFIFPLTVTAYYLGTDVTSSALATDLRTTRNYGLAFTDLYLTKTRGEHFSGQGWIKDGFKVDVGYWISGGGKVVHYWIVKMTVTTFTS